MYSKIKDNASLIRFLYSQSRRFRTGLLLAVGRSVMIAPLPWLFSVIIDQHVPSANIKGIVFTGVVFIGLLMLHTAFSVSGARYIGGAITRMAEELRSLIFNRMQFLSFGYLDQNATGRLLSKYAFDTQRIQDITITILNQIVPTLFYSFGVGVIMIVLNWQLAIFTLLFVPVLYFARFYFHKRLEARNREARLAQENLTGSANEMISALRLVRSLGEESRAENRLGSDNQRLARARELVISMSSVFGTFLFVSNQAISLLVVACGALMVINDMMSLGTLFAFMAALPILMQPFAIIAQFIEQYVIGQESYYSVRELITSPYVDTWRGKTTLDSMRGEIEFSHIDFAYPTKTDTQVLGDFSLHIKAGENIALVGASGSGKSTLANLILGLYPTTAGVIRIDGVPQAELDMRAFRRRCAIVMQDNLLLSGSILENIRFAREDATDEEIYAAVRAANAENFIRALPKGYQTKIGERGVSLSGGQRQRLSIARAILRNPQILILDEATSALDNESESLIQEALEKLAKGRTVITIAHRLSTIRNADRIIVMGQGKILEQGTFDHLSRQSGAFSRLLDAHTKQSVAATPAAS
jgi:ABC-type multidrug transport system fused ATPase/permease subunit